MEAGTPPGPQPHPCPFTSLSFSGQSRGCVRSPRSPCLYCFLSPSLFLSSLTPVRQPKCAQVVTFSHGSMALRQSLRTAVLPPPVRSWRTLHCQETLGDPFPQLPCSSPGGDPFSTQPRSHRLTCVRQVPASTGERMQRRERQLHFKV